MDGLELRFLGDFEVRRDGRALALPPSRKTKALLAYLCLQPRRFSREHLCQLLWDVPDDPRGSLRWSLSKLRALLDDERRRLVRADRGSVGIDTTGLSIDVLDLRQCVAAGLQARPTAELEAAALRFRGNLLEGLDFSNFHDFHAWCVAEREQAVRDRIALLGEIARRLSGQPERALPHVRALVGLSPYDESLRSWLVRQLIAARQYGEAEDQFQLGLRLLKEAAIAPSGELVAARRPLPAEALVATPPAAAALDDPSPAAVAPDDPSPAAMAPAAAAPTPALRPLHGRQTETRLIAQALDAVCERRCCTVLLVSGAAGIGKSRLLQAVHVQALRCGALALQGAAFEAEAIRPFGLWIDALRTLPRDEAAALFAGTDGGDRERLFARLADFVAGRSARQPLVLLFDDVQWCDESSAAALHVAARMNRARPLLIVLAARDGELCDNAPIQQALRGLRRDGLLRELVLGPLAPDDLAHLIEEAAPGADSRGLSWACGGNPLLAIELARARVGGAAVESLGELVRERLARCGVAATEVLRWAAVLNPRIELRLLGEVSGVQPGDVAAALELGQRQALLQATDRGLAFAHELIARAVYDDISPLRRQLMHRRVAELLEVDSTQRLARAADLAHHATLAGDAALAARAMVSAGRLCLRFFANDDAQSLARKGLQLAEGLPEAERVCVQIDLHDVLLAARPVPDGELAARQFEALAERALDHGEMAHARLGYHMAAWIRWTQGQWSAAREQSLQAMRVARGAADDAHIVGMAEAAKCLVLIERDISQADAMLMEAGALARRRGFTHHALTAGLGLLRFHENRLDEAQALLREARILCKAAGDRVNEFQACEYLVLLDFQRGRLAQARQGCADLLALGDRLRGGSEEPFGRAMAGLCGYATDGTTAELESALEDLRIADAKHRLATVLTRAALVDCARGRLDAAGRHAEEALRHAQLLERPTELLLAQAVLAHRARALGDAAGAARWSHEVERVAAAGPAAWAPELVHALADGSEAMHGQERQ